MNHNREWWERKRRALECAMAQVAKRNSSPIIKAAMGSLAWGRYEGEPKPSESKDDVIAGCGYLEGVHHTLLCLARDRQLDESGLGREFRDVWARFELGGS